MISNENIKLLKKLVNIHIENLASDDVKSRTYASISSHSFDFEVFSVDESANFDDDFECRDLHITSANQEIVNGALKRCVKACEELL